MEGRILKPLKESFEFLLVDARFGMPCAGAMLLFSFDPHMRLVVQSTSKEEHPRESLSGDCRSGTRVSGSLATPL